MTSFTFRTIIMPDEGGTFHGYAPALPGCHTWGDSLDDTRLRLKEALEVYIKSLIDDGESVPQDQGYELLETVTLAEPQVARA